MTLVQPSTAIQAGAPILIGHRGVPGLRLEHTRPSYELAIEFGTEFIEPDVVATCDGHLVVRHENEISQTTDVADHREFRDRHTTKVVDGNSLSGWFTEDFTLAELKTLRTRERIPDVRPANVALNGREQILTFAEVVDIARAAQRPDYRVGVYVETKHPTYFGALGHDLNALLLEQLQLLDLNRADADVPVVIQSMESANLRALRPHTDLPLIQLMENTGAPYDFIAAGDPRTYADLATAKGIAFVAGYADGIGPHKSRVISRDKNAYLTHETGLVDLAHQAGLWVHIWTMRNENQFLPADFRRGDAKADEGDAEAEYHRFFDAGVDGVFTDFMPTARHARHTWQTAAQSAEPGR